MSQRSFVENLIIDFCAIMSSSVSTQQMCRGDACFTNISCFVLSQCGRV